MSKRLVFAFAAAAMLTLGGYARAHEGHPHKVMGTVATLQENRLEVKSTDGKMVLVVLNEKTKIFRGKARVKREDIKPDERIVVTALQKDQDGKPTMVATEVRLAPA